VVREEQLITLSGFDSGFFSLAGVSSSGVGVFSDPVNVSEADTHDILCALQHVVDGCQDFEITRTSEAGSRTLYRVEFLCPVATQYPLFSVRQVNLTVAPGASPAMTVVRTREASEPLAGSIRIGFGGNFTEAMDITSWDLEQLLEELPGIGDVEVSRFGNMEDSGSWLVVFRDPAGNVPELEINATELSGSELNVTVTVQQEGSFDSFYDPVPADFFEIPTAVTQVRVEVNSILAECADAHLGQSKCALAYVAGLTPTVTNISVDSPAEEGDTVVLRGLGFDDAPNTTVTVLVGARDGVCTITSISATEIKCKLSANRAGSYLPTVIFSSIGTAQVSQMRKKGRKEGRKEGRKRCLLASFPLSFLLLSSRWFHNPSLPPTSKN
jgi:hypothetical protein